MRIKIVVSLSIFLLLLSAAWLLQQQNHRAFDVDKTQSQLNRLNVVPINRLNTNSNAELPNVQQKRFEPFKPREYVRVIGS